MFAGKFLRHSEAVCGIELTVNTLRCFPVLASSCRSVHKSSVIIRRNEPITVTSTEMLTAIECIQHARTQLMPRRVEALARQLGGDGMLVLRLMVQNAGEIVTSLVVGRLYDLFAVGEK